MQSLFQILNYWLKTRNTTQAPYTLAHASTYLLFFSKNIFLATVVIIIYISDNIINYNF